MSHLGIVTTPPEDKPAPCIPSRLRSACWTCSRFSPHLPHRPEYRPHTLVIDAAVVGGVVCPMYEASDRHWWVERERESALEAA